MAQAVVLPSQRRTLCRDTHVIQLVVAPCVVETNATEQDDVQHAVLILPEDVGEIQQQVDVGSDVFPCVELVQIFESALRLPGIDMQAGTHRGCKIMSKAQRSRRREELVHRGVGGSKLKAALCLYV